MKELFNGKTCKAEHSEEKRYILFTFNGYAKIEEHKEMYNQITEYIKKHPIVSIIMDFREMKGTFTGLNDWVIDKFRPLVALGLKKSGMILNDDIFTSFAADDASKKVKLIELQVFKTMEDCEKWATS